MWESKENIDGNNKLRNKIFQMEETLRELN